MASAEVSCGSEWDSRTAGVYLHLPFCSAICPYCDFAVTLGGRNRRVGLVEALLLEIERQGGRFDHPVDTIYFGGGTPSLIEPDDLARLLESVRSAMSLEDSPRIYLEANPEDVTDASLEAWLALGLATLSLGVQSLDDAALAFLGRRHSAAQAFTAIDRARSAGVDTVSVDLIYSRPGQSAADWSRELGTVASLEPDHLSCYQLTVNRGTRFGRLRDSGRLSEMPEPEQAELFETTHRSLEELGYEAYEVSSFARRPRDRSRHNIKYWTGAPYLGLGPSAHSFAGGTRWWNVADTDIYVDRISRSETVIESSESLAAGERLLEELMMGLRTPRGVDLAEIRERYGIDLLEINRQGVERWIEEHLVTLREGMLEPTLSGLLLADRLAAELDLGPLEPVVRR